MVKETTQGAATGIGMGCGCCAAPFLIAGALVLALLIFVGWAMVAGSQKMVDEETARAKAVAGSGRTAPKAKPLQAKPPPPRPKAH